MFVYSVDLVFVRLALSIVEHHPVVVLCSCAATFVVVIAPNSFARMCLFMYLLPILLHGQLYTVQYNVLIFMFSCIVQYNWNCV